MLLTEAQLQQIKDIVAKYHSAFVATAISPDAVPKSVLEALRREGLIRKDGFRSIEDAYLLGQVSSILGADKAANMSLAQLRAYFTANPIPLTGAEKQAVVMANQRAAQYCVGLGNKVDTQTGALLIEADDRLRRKMRDTIATKTAANLASRETAKQLKSDLGWATKDWTRDLDRIAVTEKQTAMQTGQADAYAAKHGPDCLVYKRPTPDACPRCLALYLTASGAPRVFTLRELESNGTNVGRKSSAWEPVIGPTHPHCACQLLRKPPGTRFDAGGSLTFGSDDDDTDDDTPLERALIAPSQPLGPRLTLTVPAERLAKALDRQSTRTNAAQRLTLTTSAGERTRQAWLKKQAKGTQQALIAPRAKQKGPEETAWAGQLGTVDGETSRHAFRRHKSTYVIPQGVPVVHPVAPSLTLLTGPVTRTRMAAQNRETVAQYQRRKGAVAMAATRAQKTSGQAFPGRDMTGQGPAALVKGVGGMRSHKYIKKEFVGGRWVYTYADKMGKPQAAGQESESSPTSNPATPAVEEKHTTPVAMPVESEGESPAPAKPRRGRPPNKTPREAAATSTEAAKPREYAFARESAITNKGEDLLASARHKRNEWRGLADAEAHGTASSMVRRDVLLNTEPLDLHDKVTEANAGPILAAYFALKKFPSSPANGRLDKHLAAGGKEDDTPILRIYEDKKGQPLLADADKETNEYAAKQPGLKLKLEQTAKQAAENTRAAYLTAYLGVRKAAERAAQASTANSAIGIMRAEVQSHIDALKNDLTAPGVYNQLVGYFNTTLSYGRSRSPANSVAAAVSEFTDQADSKHMPGADQASVVKAILDGQTVGKALGSSTPAQSGGHKKETFKVASLYTATAERKGPPKPALATPKGQEHALLHTMGIRGLQWGNSVTDDERAHHLKFVAESFSDLADVTGLPEAMMSFNGRLGVAIGARGRANAMAHYEDTTKVINLNRTNGAGSLAHEWGHFFDNICATLNGHAQNRYQTESYTKEGAETSVTAAFLNLRSSPEWRNYKRRMAKTEDFSSLSAANQKYFLSTSECFSRCFESYVQHKLGVQGQSNTYLSGQMGSELWPDAPETAALAPHFDAIFAAFKASPLLKKALSMLKGRVSLVLGLGQKTNAQAFPGRNMTGSGPAALTKSGTRSHKYVKKTFVGGKWVYTYADDASKPDRVEPTAPEPEPVKVQKHANYRNHLRALQSYQQDSKYIQDLCRGHSKLEDGHWMYKEAVAKTSLLGEMVAHSPLPHDMTVYRGTGDERLLALAPGDVYSDLGFTSTSQDMRIARSFATLTYMPVGQTTVITIRLKKGQKAMNVADHLPGHEAQEEKEILLPRGTKLRIISVSPPDNTQNRHHIEAEVVE